MTTALTATTTHHGTRLSWVDTDGRRWCSCGHPTHADRCPVRRCPCADVNRLMITGDLADMAARITDRLRDNGFPADGAVNRNVLCLAEEVGEFVGAYRRWSGQARRQGSAADMHAELADVVITAYVTAHEIGFDLDTAISAKLAVVFSRGWREPPASDVDTPPETVPCGLGCGYLADSEADLNHHEHNDCDRRDPWSAGADPTRSGGDTR